MVTCHIHKIRTCPRCVKGQHRWYTKDTHQPKSVDGSVLVRAPSASGSRKPRRSDITRYQHSPLVQNITQESCLRIWFGKSFTKESKPKGVPRSYIKN